MENQRFNSYDVLSVYGGLAVCIVAVIVLFKDTKSALGGSKVEQEMVQLSRQVLSGGLSTLAPEESSRGPASDAGTSTNEGRIGQDPWGQPYLYKIYQTNNGSKSVLIWSYGPDGSNDTKVENVLMSQSGNPLRVLSKADDLTHIESGR